MTHESLALKLRVLRAELALNIHQAAQRAGVTPETISDAERGKRRPYLPTLRKLAAAYGVPVEELLAEEARRAEPVPLTDAGSTPAGAPDAELIRRAFGEHDIPVSDHEAAALSWGLHAHGTDDPVAYWVHSGVDNERVSALLSYALLTGLLEVDPEALAARLRRELVGA